MHIKYGTILGRFVGLFGPYAITFGHTVYSCKPILNEQEKAHEYCHTLQYTKYGFWGFIRKYLWLWVKFGYRNHPMEVEAYLYSLRNQWTQYD